MNKKNFILAGLVVVLAAAYVVWFTDWFRPKPIQISHTNRPIRSASGPSVAHMVFKLGDDYELTEIKVVPLDALKNNPLAQPAWHLVGNSDSINTFTYGENIDGMDPAVEGARAEPLQPGVTYRLFVRAGSVKGQHDFQIGAAPGK